MAKTGDFVGMEVQGLEELKAKLAKLPGASQDFVTDEVNKYMLDVMRQYPPEKYVSRKDAYGETFFTAKQRRYFFWALDQGIIGVPYRRTQAVRRGWQQVGKGRRSFLANAVPYAAHLFNDDQSRHAAKIGWKTITQTIKERMSRIIVVADGAIKKAIKKVGLS
jgi:hypothetical protein